MMPEGRYSRARVNTFPLQRIRKQQSKYCWAITIKMMFSVGSAERLYNEDPRPAEKIVGSLEAAVEDN
jgi:hypothetical protein